MLYCKSTTELAWRMYLNSSADDAAVFRSNRVSWIIRSVTMRSSRWAQATRSTLAEANLTQYLRWNRRRRSGRDRADMPGPIPSALTCCSNCSVIPLWMACSASFWRGAWSRKSRHGCGIDRRSARASAESIAARNLAARERCAPTNTGTPHRCVYAGCTILMKRCALKTQWNYRSDG